MGQLAGPAAGRGGRLHAGGSLPPADEPSPLDGEPAPPGHGIDDAMWPWVGDAAGFDVAIPPSVKALLPDFSAAPAATVRQVLNTETIDAEGYHYAPPADG